MSAAGIFASIKGALAAAIRGPQAFLAWGRSFFDPTCPTTSTRRLLMMLAGATLCQSCYRITTACVRVLEGGGHLTMGDVGLFSAATVPLGALAGAAYLGGPPQKGNPPTPSTTPGPATDPDQPPTATTSGEGEPQ